MPENNDTRDARFACPCCGQNYMNPRLVYYVEEIERALGGKLKVNSGYRCEIHNRAVGGSPTSSHCRGHAVDVACRHSRPRWRIVSKALELGITRIGIGRTFLHLDIDRHKDPDVIWLY